MCGLFQFPAWVKAAVDRWLVAAGSTDGPLFRAINKARRIAKSGFSPKVIWGVVKSGCSKCGLDGVAPHDLRERVLDYATRLQGSWSRSSFYLVM